MQLNSFQIYILKQLNSLLPLYVDIGLYKSAWLTNNLLDTEDVVNLWVAQLVNNRLIKEQVNTPSMSFRLLPGMGENFAPWSTYSIAQPGRDYLASLTVEKEKGNAKIEKAAPVNPTNALEYLNCLKGKWQKRKIMSDADHKKLVDYTVYLIDHNALPEQISKIPNTNISKSFLQETYYRLYKKYRESVDRDKFIKFLHKVFQQFDKCKQSTTSAKFSSYPGNYDNDKSLIG